MQIPGNYVMYMDFAAGRVNYIEVDDRLITDLHPDGIQEKRELAETYERLTASRRECATLAYQVQRLGETISDLKKQLDDAKDKKKFRRRREMAP